MRVKPRPGIALAALALLLLVIVLFSMHHLVTPPQPELTTHGELGRTLTRFPAHLPAYRRLADLAFDLPGERSSRLWREAYGATLALAPKWAAPRRAFVRQGFFHWTELNEADRRMVLGEAAVLMRDPETFASLYQPIWQLTQDFNYLQRTAPSDVGSWQLLMRLAAQQGQFQDYREIRGRLPRLYEQALGSRPRVAPDQLLSEMLSLQLTDDYRPVLVAYLRRLEATPPGSLNSEPRRLLSFLDYASSAQLNRLESLAGLIEDERLPATLRARLALALGQISRADALERRSLNRTVEWTDYLVARALYAVNASDLDGAEERLRLVAPADARHPAVLAARVLLATRGRRIPIAESLATEAQGRNPPGLLPLARWASVCNGAICGEASEALVFTRAPSTASAALSVSRTDDVQPYVEVFVDGRRVGEGPIQTSRVFEVPVGPGLHRVSLRLVNPIDGNGQRRVVQISA